MSQSVDPGHFFQSDASEATRARRAAKAGNKNGTPIVLQSKIINAIADPFSPSCIYVAESAGCVRRVNVDSKDTSTVYRGPTAPVTSVAIGGQGGATVYAGCWDKDIWSWDRETRTLGRRFKGHSDFVKTILCAKLDGKDVLISGGADSKIIVWDTATGERLHTLRDKSDTMMALQYLALDPEETTDSELILVSASSDPHIRRWRIDSTSASEIPNSQPGDTVEGKLPRNTILEHGTSVYQIMFSGDEQDSDLWTASADGTAKCLSRTRNWTADETYEHGDYVRAIAVTAELVITAGRDENVKIWDRASGKLSHVYGGHFEEVTGLVSLENGRKIVSVSIDRTVRTWGLRKQDLEKARKDEEEKLNGIEKEKKTAPKKSLMTAEEEAELAELMDSDDE